MTAFRDDSSRAPIPLGQACLAWLGAWLAGQVLAAAVGAASGHSSVNDAGPVWLLLVAVAGWVPLLAVLWATARRYGLGDLRVDFGLRFRPIDLVGIPVGVATQLGLLRLVYWPLERAWPGTFDRASVEERARTLADHATGAGVLLLVLVVVVGAPVVEELVYRGLLQQAFTRTVPRWAGVVVVAVWFAAVHFQPVETPGLFVVGMVLGSCALLTGRLGAGVLAHMAFNATGLVLVAWA